MVVDSANGAGAALDPEKFVFMNTDTVMHLHRLPAGNDFALRARGSIGPDGIGVTTADIFDRQGFIGTSAQTLLVQRRPGPLPPGPMRCVPTAWSPSTAGSTDTAATGPAISTPSSGIWNASTRSRNE